MESVYLLWHTHIDESLESGEDVKLIGVYSTMSTAEEALSRTKILEGFKEQPENFEISRKELDKDGWTFGFVNET